MATCATNVYWSKGYTLTAAAAITSVTFNGEPMRRMVSFTATPDPPHECEVIQRMSEAYHDLIRQGLI